MTNTIRVPPKRNNSRRVFLIGKRSAIMFLNGKRETDVIKSWKHKGLQKLFEKGDVSGVQAQDAERIKLRLLVLDEATSTDEFRNYPGFRCHPLKGDRKNLYSITVRANWRITFEFTDGDAYILNLEDYH